MGAAPSGWNPVESTNVCCFRDFREWKAVWLGIPPQGEVVEVVCKAASVFNDLQTQARRHALPGKGIREKRGVRLEPLLASKAVVQVLPDWAEERYALTKLSSLASSTTPAKVRAFLDSCWESGLPRPKKH